MSEKQKIGWIGTGKMGTPMSKNILKSGYPLTVYDLFKENTEGLADLGASVADSPKALASEVDVIISMIPDDPVLEAVYLDADGAFRGAEVGSIFIDMSTVSPIMSSRVANAAEKKDIQYLRAPVSGSTALAASADLTIFASGPKGTYEKCEGIFGAMGKKTFYVGPGEEARYLKLVLNMMVGLTSAMMAEALTFGEKGGIDWELMIEIVNHSVVASPLVNYKAQMMKDRNYMPAFTTAQMAKDFDMALSTGNTANVAMPLTSIVRQFFGAMMAKGGGEQDFFGLVTLFEEMAGL